MYETSFNVFLDSSLTHLCMYSKEAILDIYIQKIKCNNDSCSVQIVMKVYRVKCKTYLVDFYAANKHNTGVYS